MTAQLALTAHSAPPNWYASLPRPAKFDASNSIVCRCGQVIAYTWRQKQYAVVDVTCFNDLWTEMSRCQ